MIRRANLLTIPLALAVLASGAAAQEPPPPEPDVPPPTWPELTGSETEHAKVLVHQLAAEEPEEAQAAEAELTTLGAGVAPYLLARLGDRRPESTAALRRVLHRVVEPVYAPLVAEKADSRSALVREWSLEFLALQHDPRWRKVFEKNRKHKEKEIVFRACLGLAALKDTDALEEVFVQCMAEEWRDHAELVSRCLAPARSDEMAEWLVRHMPRDDEHARITGLRLMRSLAPKEYAGVIATFLDSEQHAVKKEAINALRAVVDGDEPLENLSVFQAIDQAKKWKERVR